MHVTTHDTLVHRETMSNAHESIKRAAKELSDDMDNKIVDAITNIMKSKVDKPRGLSFDEIKQMLNSPMLISAMTPLIISNVVNKYTSSFVVDPEYWTSVPAKQDYHPVPLHTLPPNGLHL